jgi:integrase
MVTETTDKWSGGGKGLHRDDKPMAPNDIRREGKLILGQAGPWEIRQKNLRHTFASLLLSDAAGPVYQAVEKLL